LPDAGGLAAGGRVEHIAPHMQPARGNHAVATPKHLFICGCPRSGTTALWSLLTFHPQVVLGVERYVHHAFRKGSLNPALFQRDRFFRIEPGDTFYPDLAGFNPYYRLAEQRFDQATYVGDKGPPYYLEYETIEQNFEDAHIVFILRNIIDVAGSYQKRAKDKNDTTWSEDRNFVRATKEWWESIRTTLDFLAKPGRRTKLTIVGYEELFLQFNSPAPIFAELGLGMTQEVETGWAGLKARSRDLEKARGDGLNSAQRYYISMQASFGLYRQLMAQRLALAPQPAAG
jgi:hypothetical protein